jgi:hypothetical protein
MHKPMTLLAVCLTAAGCNLEEQTKPTGSKVFHQTTTAIEKFDPNAPNQRVSKGEFTYSNPITGPLEAYGPILERAVLPQVNHAVDLFHAAEGRYPKDYDEFMSRIIKTPEGTIKLPVLPGDKRYAYDVKNHTLIVVEKTTTSP